MRRKSLLTVGFLSLMAATAALSVPDSFAAHSQRVDVTGLQPYKGTQLDSAKPTEWPSMRVDVIERIGSEGPSYPYTKPVSR